MGSGPVRCVPWTRMGRASSRRGTSSSRAAAICLCTPEPGPRISAPTKGCAPVSSPSRSARRPSRHLATVFFNHPARDAGEAHSALDGDTGGVRGLAHGRVRRQEGEVWCRAQRLPQSTRPSSQPAIGGEVPQRARCSWYHSPRTPLTSSLLPRACPWRSCALAGFRRSTAARCHRHHPWWIDSIS